MKTKDEKLYIVINVILMLIILVLGIFIYVVIRSNRKEIINQIKDELSEKWDISRLSKISLAILKLAVYEMLYAKVPYKVVINEVVEAVELAKKYGDDSTPAFVNGILASVVKKNKIEEQ